MSSRSLPCTTPVAKYAKIRSVLSMLFMTWPLGLGPIGLLLFALVARCDQLQFDLDAVPFEDADSAQNRYDLMAHDSLLWGPYRSSNYLGIRPRLPQSLLAGLMWFNVDTFKGMEKAKLVYEQFNDMNKANWVLFDPRYGGRQEISDNDFHINITIDFVKSDNGKNWGVKIRTTPFEGYESVKTSFVWYAGLESGMLDENGQQNMKKRGQAMLDLELDVPDMELDGFFKLDNPPNPRGYRGEVSLSGFSKELGMFEMKINDGGNDVKNVHPRTRGLLTPELDAKLTHHISLRVPDKHVWRAPEIFMSLLQDCVKDLLDTFSSEVQKTPPHLALLVRNLHNYEGNLHLVQKTYQGASEFDIVYNELASPSLERITFENIDERINGVLSKFNQKFSSHFALPNASKSEKKMAKEMLSGLLGGLSYFHGNHLVDRVTSIDFEDLPVNEEGDVIHPKLQGVEEGPHELFTLVPSRPFFPRGFYWDEGFHLLPLLKYDTDLALDIVKSWFNLIDDNGWIAREQILGDEARSRVPADYVVQSTSVINPPTLMLAFTYLLDKAAVTSGESPVILDENSGEFDKHDLGLIVLNNPGLLANYTKQIYPHLKLHFESVRRTLQGVFEEFDRGDSKELYRWIGRTSTHSLASGLDDYPRYPTMDSAELNVDLLCWIGVMTRSIKKVAQILQIDDDVQAYSKIENEITDNIARIHWSEEDQVYCDVSVDEQDENAFACYKGYVSIFPLITKFIPPASVDKLEAMVNLVSDPEEMWSNYGIRSISKSSEYYRTGENYWRSAIWMNINYLVVDTLAYYYEASERYALPELLQKIDETYTNLRRNLINNVRKEWERTGFVWELYDDRTGEAKGAKNFLGWSSSVLLLMEMPETLKK